jgi:hypothetical protein
MLNNSTLLRYTSLAMAISLLIFIASAHAQTTSFTHQGILSVPDGVYEFEFKLFDTPTVGTGTQQGSTIQKLAPNDEVEVANNAFTVELSFTGVIFTGAELYLETSWRAVGGGAFTVVSPRERITAVYANHSLSANAATNATQLGGIPPSGYIQNTTTQQQGTSFNIGGTGTANIINATTQYNLNGVRMFSSPELWSLFAGNGAGAAITTGYANSFFGAQAGNQNTTGNRNSFFGVQAGLANTTGIGNSIFGAGAGFSSTTGNSNSFFGGDSGKFNTTGFSNSFFGAFSGYQNTTGYYNAFFGDNAGGRNTTGTGNTFIGMVAGFDNTTGINNTFVGYSSGRTNTTGSNNTTIGYGAGTASANLINATAIGAFAQVSQSNSLVLGSISGVNGAAANTLIGIGTTAPTARLHVSTTSTNFGDNTALFAAPNIGPNLSHIHHGTMGDWYIRSASSSGRVILQDLGGNVGIGTGSPEQKLHVTSEILSTGAGAGLKFRNRGSSTSDDWVWYSHGNVARLFRSGTGDLLTITTSGAVTFGGVVALNAVGSAGGLLLCRNPSNQISHCSSSLRYKNNIAALDRGFDLINQLRPVTYDWKASGERDLGLVAEEVAKVEPLLVTRNEKGEIEGVKYDRITVALINVVKQQQSQIEALKKLVCKDHPEAELCR